jgi:ABC-type branched-subunit amino acid transport system substrate-binding protein
VRANLRDELGKVTEHLATIGITRLGLFYENGTGTAGLLAAADEAAAKAHATIVQKVGYEAGTAKVTVAVDAFLKSPPQAILLVSSGAAAAGFIEQYRSAGGTAQLFAHSGADVEQLSKRLSEEQMQGVAIAQVTPSPYKIGNRLAKEFADLAARTPNLEVPVSYAMMEGFIAAKVIVEGVRRQGARPTREGMVPALDGMASYDLGGYVVGFKPNMHAGSRFVELSIISGAGKIRQ